MKPLTLLERAYRDNTRGALLLCRASWGGETGRMSADWRIPVRLGLLRCHFCCPVRRGALDCRPS